MTAIARTGGQRQAGPKHVRKTPDPASIDVARVGETLRQCLTRRQMKEALRTTDACLHRWQSEGCVGRDGQIHVMPSVRIGQRYYTHRDDLAAFLAAINAPTPEGTTDDRR